MNEKMMFGRVILPRLFLFVLVLMTTQAMCAGPVAAAERKIKNAVTKIYVVNSRHDYHEPWQMKGQGSAQGSGVIIEGERILTSAHVVSDQRFVQVRRAGHAERYSAKVELVGHESDLAVLTVAERGFYEDALYLDIGELPEIRDKVNVYGFPEGGDKMSITEGVVSRVEHNRYSHSGAYLLNCQIDASINSGNSGGPVIKDGKIVGLAFQGLGSDQYENIGYMVPAPVIKHFLTDIADGRHDGTPDLGVRMQKMENPDIRERFRMKKRQSGVLVDRIFPNSPAEAILRIDDIILAIEGQKIANDGTIEFRDGERTYFGYVVQQRQIGDSVLLELLRGGQVTSARIHLSEAVDFDRLVPQRQYEIPPTYFIIGGFLFQPLTLNYLLEYGETAADWPTALAERYLNGEPSEGRRKAVVLTKVLADDINAGYQAASNLLVSKVNGRDIGNMKDLVAAFKSEEGPFHVIEDKRGYRYVLSREKTM